MDRTFGVRILDVSHVSPSRLPIPPHETLKLSFFDTIWIGITPVQRLFFYQDTNLPFPSLLETLKSSLSLTLLHYYPLAGKLTYLPSSSDVVVDCSAAGIGEGVAFVEAESDADLRKVASDETYDLEFFLNLLPKLDVRELPAPVFGVQVTRFGDGGVAVGFTAHHAVADGLAIRKFGEAWAGACRVQGGARFDGPRPMHDREVIRHPRGDEIARLFLRQMTPSLPSTALPYVPIQGQVHPTLRTFLISESSIQSLKDRAMMQSSDHFKVPPPSTFVVMSAHAWISFLHAKGIKGDEDIVLSFPVDCRTRLDPPVEEDYFGNCVRPCYALSKGSELLGEDGLARACAVIKKAIQEILEEPLRGCEDWISSLATLPFSRRVNVMGSSRFKVYETDFGWGRPSRAEFVLENSDGDIALVVGRDGGIQASAAVFPSNMKAFAAFFIDGLVS